MTYVVSITKALLLVAALRSTDGLEPGQPALCPTQTEGVDDEELDCEVLALSREAGIVVLVPRAYEGDER